MNILKPTTNVRTKSRPYVVVLVRPHGPHRTREALRGELCFEVATLAENRSAKFDFNLEAGVVQSSMTELGGAVVEAPKRTTYPSESIEAWQRRYPDVRLRFAVPGADVDALKQEIRQGSPEHGSQRLGGSRRRSTVDRNAGTSAVKIHSRLATSLRRIGIAVAYPKRKGRLGREVRF